MAINPQTKGKTYERQIAKVLAKAFDCDVRRTPGSGNLDIKGDLRNLYGPLEDYVFELKKQEKINIWACIHQSQLEAGYKQWVLIFSRNRENDYVCMDLQDWIALVQKASAYQNLTLKNEHDKLKGK